MKILVTGSAGFIGFHVSRALLLRGDEVRGLDNFNDYYDPTLKEARNALLERERSFTLIRGDLTDRDVVQRAVVGVDRVVHLAAAAGVRHSIDHPEEFIRSNLVGFQYVLDAVRDQRTAGFVYASSSSVYGDCPTPPVRETADVLHPLSLYGATKVSNEVTAAAYHQLSGIPMTGLRFFTVYGPWGRPDMALFSFTKAILEGRAIDVYNRGDHRRDFTYIDDIVAGVLAAIDRNPAFEVFNLGRGRAEPLLDFIAEIERACGRKAQQRLLPMQAGDVHVTHADITHARQALGYDPQTSIAEGIPKFVAWYREYYRI